MINISTQYLTHRRLRGKILCGREVNIPAGTIFHENNHLITFPDGDAVCYTTSQIGKEYFARNDDGNGMRRGAITHEIAFSERVRFSKNKNSRQRFTDDEIQILCTKWTKYIVPERDVILFNDDFFKAEINELERIAKDLNIHIKEG